MKHLFLSFASLLVIIFPSCRNNTLSPEELAKAKRAGAIQIKEEKQRNVDSIQTDSAQYNDQKKTLDMRSEIALNSRVEAIYREVLTNQSRSYMVQNPAVNHVSPAPKNVEYFTGRYAIEAEQLPCTTCDEYSVWEGEFHGSGSGTTRFGAIDSTRISGDTALVFITLITKSQPTHRTRTLRLLYQRENWFVDGFR